MVDQLTTCLFILWFYTGTVVSYLSNLENKVQFQLKGCERKKHINRIEPTRYL